MRNHLNRRTKVIPAPLTLNHILIVDWYYLDALEAGGRGRAVYESELPFPDAPGLARAQEAARAVAEFTRSMTGPLGRGDQRTAVAAMRAMFRDPLFGNLRLRREVECAVLEDVAGLPEPPVDFCLAAISAFGWDDDPGHLPPESRAVAARLGALVEGGKRVAGLRRRARLWVLRMWVDRTALAAAMLTGVYRPLLFRLARFDPLTVRAVRSLLKDIHAHSGGAAARNLDQRVIAWWDGAVADEPAPPARPDRAA